VYVLILVIYKVGYLEKGTLTDSLKRMDMFTFVIAYAVGVIFSNVFYRECIGNACKAAVLGGEMVGKSTENIS